MKKKGIPHQASEVKKRKKIRPNGKKKKLTKNNVTQENSFNGERRTISCGQLLWQSCTYFVPSR